MDFIYSLSFWTTSFYWFWVGVIVLILSVIAWRDWKTRLIHLADNLYLVIAATALLLMAGDWRWPLVNALVAASLGFGIVVAKIIYDTRSVRDTRISGRSKEEPHLSIHLGDAVLFASTGFLLGTNGMAVAFVLNAPLFFAHHFWLAKREKRSIWNGYAPVAPAYCLAVALVFGFQINQGGMA